MQERSRELASEARLGKKKAAGEADLLAKIDEMPAPDRAMALALHGIVKECAPTLTPKTWYGMPAYAKDDKVLCFFQGAKKFDTRYATLGFTDQANLDAGNLWATAFALTRMTSAEEAKIRALLKKAVR